MSDRISIVVVDDHPLFRQGVVSALQGEPDFQVVGETDSGEQALQLARTLMPQVMLLDVSMTGWNGIQTAEKVSIACPATAIVMLTVSDDKDRLLAGVGFADDLEVGLALQGRNDPLAKERMVVDDDDADAVRHGSPPWR